MAVDRMKRQRNDVIAPKKIIYAIFISSLFIVFLYLGNRLLHSEYFPIRNVNVYGTQYVDRQELQRVVTPLINKGFFAVNVENIKDRLLQIPWISKVTVRRIWPDRILVTVFEKKPRARWNEDSLLSANGELFQPSIASFPSDLPELIGPEGEHIKIMQYFDQMNRILQPLHFKVARLELSPQSTWKLMLDNGMKLTVGRKDFLTQLAGFVKVYPKIVGDRAEQVQYIDLRYTNGFAVRWKV